jgi:hypothetical protein
VYLRGGWQELAEPPQERVLRLGQDDADPGVDRARAAGWAITGFRSSSATFGQVVGQLGDPQQDAGQRIRADG